MSNIVEQIKLELAKRKQKNRLYSLRAMARDLGVSVSCLSRTLSGKTKLSPQNEALIRDALGL